MENRGIETLYWILEKRDMEQFHEVFAGVQNISTKPGSGYATLWDSLWVKFGAKFGSTPWYLSLEEWFVHPKSTWAYVVKYLYNSRLESIEVMTSC